MPGRFWTFILTVIFFWGSLGSATAQDTDSSEFIRRLKKIGDQETYNSIQKYRAGQIAIRQQVLLEGIRSVTERAKIYLKNGLDTTGILQTLNSTNHSLELVKDGVFVNAGSSHSQRDLAVSAAILSELMVNMARVKNEVATYTHDLVSFRNQIDSLSMDSALYTFPKDSIGSVKYISRLKVIAREIGPVDTALDQSLANIQDLHNKVDASLYAVRFAQEEIEKFRVQQTAETFERNFPNITAPAQFSRPFPDIVNLSLAKEKLALGFYLYDNPGRILFLVLGTLLLTIYIRSLRLHLQRQGGLHADFSQQLILKRPAASAIILSVSLFQFIFLNPPFIFSFFLWLVAGICLALLFKGFITPWWMRFWVAMLVFFLLAGLDNMLLQASREERWFMLGLSAAGAIFSLYVLFTGRKGDLKEKGILYFIAFVAVMELAATLFNFTGRYNLGKTLLITGYSGLVIAILFLWTVRLLNELLRISNSVYKHPDKKLVFLNFDRIGDKVHPFFYVVLVFGWFLLVGRNSYAFTEIIQPVKTFLTKVRSVGDYNFSINGLFVFFVILLSSLLLSRIISFFTAEPNEQNRQGDKNGRIELGSWLLLVRILVISLGIFLAFAASGIPLDKITIILGALGVGIGLGLQSLVNNLVSGLIIAFEKPVNVGDSIEVNGRPGTMKSIGFRSSVVALQDGSFLIIPNGDLLSQQLINWSMGKHIKRLKISVGVAYGTDLSLVKQTISELLKKEQRILNAPPAQILAREFAASSIDFDIHFWVPITTDSLLLKSEVITQIEAAFKAAGIEIPMPQQEVHIRPDA